MLFSDEVEVHPSEDESSAVSAIEMEAVTAGFERAPHHHHKAQLILGIKGLITCKVDRGLWMVPPQSAVWIPGGLEHSVRVSGSIELYVLYIEPDMAPDLPRDCCTLRVSPLLRELLIAAARLPRGYDDGGPPGRLVRTLLDQLAVAAVQRLHLPLPSEPRLRRIADAILADPSDRATIGEWAKRVGLSERTLFRLLPQQTGMSFGRWRQQFHIMLALERLSEGQAVQTIAFDLGYESASAFITMFKKVIGRPPAKYFAANPTSASKPLD